MTDCQRWLKEHFLEPEVRDGVEVSAELKAAWKIMLDILEEFIRICEKYDLKYCLDGGTLIGAIRHKGFIPWDDDIDVSLPREDYHRFLEVAPKELKAPYFLQYGLTDRGHFQAFACIRNSQTSAIDLAWVRAGRRFNMGIGIDVFPFDYVPEDPMAITGMLWRDRQLRRIFQNAIMRKYVGWRKWVTRPIWHCIYRIIGHERLVKWRDRNFAAFSADDVSRYGNIALNAGAERAIFNKEVFATRVKVPFEYIEAYVPRGYESYLVQFYGADWRTPIRGKGSHEPLVVDVYTPYKELLVKRFGYEEKMVRDLPE